MEKKYGLEPEGIAQGKPRTPPDAPKEVSNENRIPTLPADLAAVFPDSVRSSALHVSPWPFPRPAAVEGTPGARPGPETSPPASGSDSDSSPPFTAPRSETEKELEATVASLRATLDELARERRKIVGRPGAQEAGREGDHGKVEELTCRMARERELLRLKEAFLRYKGRITDTAFELLRDVGSDVAQVLRPDAEIDECWVVSVDIRRSTELMLKAKSARHFSAFVTDLCHSLRRIIVAHYGVFDKFTGDGILAFFPRKYAGDAVASWVVRATDACHKVFRSTYEASRAAFRTVIDTGLGIGVDVGSVRLVDIGDGVSVVGDPVVYACRFGSANAGETLVNQTAAELLTERCLSEVSLESFVHEIKHEGKVWAYRLQLREGVSPPLPPGWTSGGPSHGSQAGPEAGSAHPRSRSAR